MEKTRVLFVCVHNSARSQMAEALLSHLAGDRFAAESAGLEPGTLNPFAVAALKEMGIDMSNKGTRDVFALYERGESYDYVVTVCDEASGERCPVFHGAGERLHWGFEDPALFVGSDVQKLQRTVRVRDQIRARIESWLKEIENSNGEDV